MVSGSVSDVYPALGRAAPDLYGLSIATASGQHFDAGDSRVRFPIMSAAKPFTFALAAQAVGIAALCAQVGVNATGLPFNSIAAVERATDGRTNPMVNAGAIATAARLPGADASERWARALAAMSLLAGRDLDMDGEIYASASETNHQNRALVHLVHQRSPLPIDPLEALDIYTRLSSLAVSAHDLAAMGSVLATGGVTPRTGGRVLDAACCRTVMAVMATEGLYERSGEWLCRVGLPGKSGIGGGVLTVSPGKGALAVFSPRLDEAGNSVRGQDASAYLSRSLGLDLFAVDVHE